MRYVGIKGLRGRRVSHKCVPIPPLKPKRLAWEKAAGGDYMPLPNFAEMFLGLLLKELSAKAIVIFYQKRLQRYKFEGDNVMSCKKFVDVIAIEKIQGRKSFYLPHFSSRSLYTLDYRTKTV